MRALIQRVKRAEVTVDGSSTGKIGNGLLILLGAHGEDSQEDIDWLARKISHMRIFSDEEDKMNLSVIDIEGEVLVVSQFTLYANTKKGNRPSFINAAKPNKAEELYIDFIKNIQTYIKKPIQTGIFGEMMDVSLVNDGPVTIWMDTHNKE